MTAIEFALSHIKKEALYENLDIFRNIPIDLAIELEEVCYEKGVLISYKEIMNHISENYDSLLESSSCKIEDDEDDEDTEDADYFGCIIGG